VSVEILGPVIGVLVAFLGFLVLAITLLRSAADSG
jgi:hypothetical protein